MKKVLFFWGPTAVWMGLIYYLSSYHAIAASSVTWQDFTVKKSAHLVIYFILAVWVYRSLKFTLRRSQGKLILWTIILVGLYAISDEIHQSFVPTRGPNIRDVAIDILGASAGALWSAKIIYSEARRNR